MRLARPSKQHAQESCESCITTDMLGLPYPGADWLDCKTKSTMLPPLDAPACYSRSQTYVKPRSAGELEIPKTAAVVCGFLLLPDLEQPLENTLASNLANIQREPELSSLCQTQREHSHHCTADSYF